MREKRQTPRRAGQRSAFFYERFAALKQDPIVKTLYGLARAEEVKLYLVGGVLREAGLERSWMKDYDLVTQDVPERVASRVAQEFRAKRFLMDRERGIWRVVKKRGRLPFTIDIAPMDGATLEEDLLKRDFTINALAVGLEDLYGHHIPPVIDPAGGIEDIKKKRLRLVSEDGFKKDPLRLVRALRLCQLHGLRVERNTRRLLKEDAPLIGLVATERIKDELMTIFSNKETAPTMREFFRVGLVYHMLPELAGWRKGGHYDMVSHSLKTLDEAERLLDDRVMTEFPALREHFVGELPSGTRREVVFKLAAFLHDCGKPETMRIEKEELKFWGHDVEGEKVSKKILKRLRVGRKISDIISTIVRNHHRVFSLIQLESPTDRARNHFFNAVGGDVGLDLLCLAIADARATRGGEDPELYAFVREMLRFYFEVYTRVRPEPMMDGHEIMRVFGVKEGVIVGEMKRKIEEGVEKGVVRDKESALGYVREWLKERKG